MSLTYDSKKLIPAPLVTINKNYSKAGDGKTLGTVYDITLTGTLLPFKGSPSGNYSNIDFAFWDQTGYPPDETFQSTDKSFNSILRKQEALRKLFSRDGRSLEWANNLGDPVVKTNPRIQSINFEEGRSQWTDGADYTINLQSDWIYINGSSNIEEIIASGLIETANESWSFEEVTGRQGLAYRVTHTVSAQAKHGYDENGVLLQNKNSWEHAKVFVDNRINGLVDPYIMFRTIGTSGSFGGEYTKNIQVDKEDGNYSVIENWLLQDSLSSFIEKTFNVNFNGETNEYSVTYNGNIRGFASGLHVGSQQALDNAKLVIPSNAQARLDASGAVSSLIDGNIIPEFPDSKNIVLNQQDSSITFSFEWNPALNLNVISEYEIAINSDIESGNQSLSLNQTLTSRGTDKVVNVRAGILADPAAFVKVSGLAGSLINNVSSIVKSKAISLNERRGSARGSWTWSNSTDSAGLEITISNTIPGNVFASIPIVGRAAGPVIQNMNTITSEIITVSINGINQISQPDGKAIADAQITNLANYLFTGGEEDYNSVKKTYRFRGSYIKLT